MAKITIGRTVLYRLTSEDASQINRRRTSSTKIVERIKENQWPLGAQAHIGNTVFAEDTFPLLVTRVWEGTSPVLVNGQVFLDGTDNFWVTSVHEGDVTEIGTWSWPRIIVEGGPDSKVTLPQLLDVLEKAGEI